MSNGEPASTSAPPPAIFRIPELAPPVVRQVMLARGWKEWVDGDPEDQWHLSWRSGRYKPSEYADTTQWQRINHFPRSGIITRKDSLLRSLRKMRHIHGAMYHFHPDGFILPTEYTKFISEYTTAASAQATIEDAGKADLWIVKPHDSSRGRKIFIMKSLQELTYDQQSIIQRYIDKPFTIGGYKLDLRLYVLLTSMHPMTLWLYGNGLVRFATAKYEGSAHGDLYSHLTNSSINKFSPTAGDQKDVIGGGCKWDLDRFRDWLVTAYGEEGKRRWAKMWKRTQQIIILTMLLIAPVVPREHSASSFEIFGFDIILDSTFKPHLVEVNCSPALGLDEPTDHQVKIPLLNDLLDLLNVEAIAKAQVEASTATTRVRSMDRQTVSARMRSASLSDATPARSPQKPPVPTGRGSKAPASGVERQGARRSRSGSQPAPSEPCPSVDGGSASSPERGVAPGTPDPPGPPLRRNSCSAAGPGGWAADPRLAGVKRGRYELIFPFNDVTAQQAERLSRCASDRKPATNKVQDCCRAIIQEVRAQERAGSEVESVPAATPPEVVTPPGPGPGDQAAGSGLAMVRTMSNLG